MKGIMNTKFYSDIVSQIYSFKCLDLWDYWFKVHNYIPCRDASEKFKKIVGNTNVINDHLILVFPRIAIVRSPI